MQSIESLRSLSCGTAYAPVQTRLLAAASSTRSTTALQLLRETLPLLQKLSPSMQRLAWFQTYGLPCERRMQPGRSVTALWSRGINRNLDIWPHARGLAHLASAWSVASDEAAATLMAQVASTHAFSTLAGDATDEEFAWEGVWLMQSVGPSACASIRGAADHSSLDSIAQIAACGEWLHSLATPDSPMAAPPSTNLTRIALSLTSLRGLRRRGARDHGRRIGRQVHAAVRSLSRGSSRELDLELPACLIGPESLRPVFAPLVQDFLSCAVAENAPHADLRQGVRTICECCPKLVRQAIEAHRFAGSHALEDAHDPPAWLDSLFGLVPFEEYRSALDARRDAARAQLDGNETRPI
jgi:hypothetical protein